MRLRLLSLIACHDGGESCVCDLLEAFDVTGAVGQLPPEDPARGRADQLRATRHLGVLPGQPGGDGADVSSPRAAARHADKMTD